MESELRLHGPRQLAGLQLVRRRFEFGHESAAASLAEISSVRARDCVVGLAPRNLLELRASGDLGPQFHQLVAGRIGIRRRDDAWNVQYRQTRAPGTVVLRLVLLEVSTRFCVGDRL